MSATADFKITRALPGEAISGKIVAALASKPAGTLVRNKNPGATIPGIYNDVTEFELANTVGGVAVLERDILADGAEIPLADLILPTGILTPLKVGDYATGRLVQEGEFEGSALVQSSTGQLINASTPVDSELTTLAGRLALRTDKTAQELAGFLRAHLLPVYVGNFRILVEFQLGAKDAV